MGLQQVPFKQAPDFITLKAETKSLIAPNTCILQIDRKNKSFFKFVKDYGTVMEGTQCTKKTIPVFKIWGKAAMAHRPITSQQFQMNRYISH